MQDAKKVKDFRPISLIGSLYKIIAKILANRIVVVLGDIVNEVQYAFVANRQILDGPFILNELIQWCNSKKKKTMIFKVNFEKAFDSVRWDYLDEVLKKFGFGDRWCSWIQSCLRSSRGSILVNRSMFKGVSIGSSMHISHLFYADDIVFIGQWCDSNISTIVHVLECFFHASGLHINMHKSKLMGTVVDDDRVNHAARSIGCLTLKSPFSYLGIKVGGLMSRIKSWDEIVNKLLARVSKWKMKTLSIGGRLTLLKSVLGSTLIYYMPMFKIPMQVLKRMESIRSRFFIGADVIEKKTSWVKGSDVLESKEKGGLGVLSFYALNRALLFKWGWRFRNDNNSLWARVIKAMRGEDGLLGKTTKSSFPSIWMDIICDLTNLKNHNINLLGLIKKKVGTGTYTLFWEDTWKGDIAFQFLYPRVYMLETCKKITVASKMAMITWASFCVVTREGSRDFSVASVRGFIDDHMLPEVSSKFRWRNVVPIKVNVHSWKVRLDFLPTRLKFSRRGLDIQSILCPSCGKFSESSIHIFFECPMARDIYRKIASW
ncbi:RNA-directed DNA polymerase, eukaryota, reverse transcriptase zinc-binding domain protein [Tanacetum coccineum]